MSTSHVLHPQDEHNQKLRDYVHPADWPADPSSAVYDMVAIGAGTGGLVSSGGAAMLGARSALIERHLMGGDCLNTGCVPSKTLIKSAHIAHLARNAGHFGVHVGEVRVDFGEVMERLRRVRADMAHHDGAERLKGLGVDVLFGTAKFTGPKTLELDGKPVRFRRAMICTGGRPFVPDIPGLRENCLTSENFFEQTELPKRLLVLGGGPIGCELAQTMQRLGAQVTMLVRGSKLMAKDDPDAGTIIQNVFQKEGLRVRFKTNLTNIERTDNGLNCSIETDGKTDTEPFDAILVAAGRRPNVENLGLDVAGVEFDKRGITVNKLHQTSNSRIYAAGDVCSPFQFTHAAYAQAEFATLNALMPFPYRLNARDRVMSWVTYTDPEVAHAGPGWSEIEKMKSDIDTYELPIKDNDRAQTESESQGFCRLHCKKGTDRLIAGTIVGENAGEMIAELSLAITNKMKLRHIQKSIHAYPTRSEIIRNVATEWKFTTLTPTMKSAVGLWFKVSRLFG
jgi:pyruvate/2-oxoglutarate dehydrogenase complex dihydrolipoamide dehydrogenase (E3) component